MQIEQIKQIDIPRYINDQREFISGSVRGCFAPGGVYEVWSYNTRILKVIGTQVIDFDSSTYSKTTTRLQNLIKVLFFTGEYNND